LVVAEGATNTGPKWPSPRLDMVNVQIGSEFQVTDGQGNAVEDLTEQIDHIAAPTPVYTAGGAVIVDVAFRAARDHELGARQRRSG